MLLALAQRLAVTPRELPEDKRGAREALQEPDDAVGLLALGGRLDRTSPGGRVGERGELEPALRERGGRAVGLGVDAEHDDLRLDAGEPCVGGNGRHVVEPAAVGVAAHLPAVGLATEAHHCSHPAV